MRENRDSAETQDVTNHGRVYNTLWKGPRKYASMLGAAVVLGVGVIGTLFFQEYQKITKSVEILNSSDEGVSLSREMLSLPRDSEEAIELRIRLGNFSKEYEQRLAKNQGWIE